MSELSFDPHFNQPVNLTKSSVHIPVEIYDGGIVPFLLIGWYYYTMCLCKLKNIFLCLFVLAKEYRLLLYMLNGCSFEIPHVILKRVCHFSSSGNVLDCCFVAF
jgi:hypothetical protein